MDSRRGGGPPPRTSSLQTGTSTGGFAAPPNTRTLARSRAVSRVGSQCPPTSKSPRPPVAPGVCCVLSDSVSKKAETGRNKGTSAAEVFGGNLVVSDAKEEEPLVLSPPVYAGEEVFGLANISTPKEERLSERTSTSSTEVLIHQGAAALAAGVVLEFFPESGRQTQSSVVDAVVEGTRTPSLLLETPVLEDATTPATTPPLEWTPAEAVTPLPQAPSERDDGTAGTAAGVVLNEESVLLLLEGTSSPDVFVDSVEQWTTPDELIVTAGAPESPNKWSGRRPDPGGAGDSGSARTEEGAGGGGGGEEEAEEEGGAEDEEGGQAIAVEDGEEASVVESPSPRGLSAEFSVSIEL